jgi:hypothetical protein
MESDSKAESIGYMLSIYQNISQVIFRNLSDSMLLIYKCRILRLTKGLNITYLKSYNRIMYSSVCRRQCYIYTRAD